MLLKTVRQYQGVGCPVLVVTSTTLPDPLLLELDTLSEVLVLPEEITTSSTFGMGDSLANGIQHIERLDWDAALIALGDMPFVKATTLQQLFNALNTRDVVVPVHDGRWGHPVGFGKAHFPALARLHGDRGGRAILQAANPFELPVNDPGVLLDIDTPEQLNDASMTSQ